VNPYVNEDVMWERLKDMQRETENRRLYGPPRTPIFGELMSLLGRRVWWIARLAARPAKSARDVA
jgi:hypothetical protein